MAYTLDVNLALGASNTGLTLEMQLKNTAGVNVGAAVTTGFVEFDSSGNYLFHYAAWPDGHRGAAVFQIAGGGAVKAAVAINAEEVENPDVKTSSVLTTLSVANIAAAVWSYVSRTLTMTAAQIVAVLTGSTITAHRGDTLSVSFTGLGNITARTKLWFTVKAADSDADTAAIVQIEETAGLVTLDGAAGTPSQGSLTVTNAAAGNVTVSLAAAATARLPARQSYRYDIQMLAGTAVTTLTEATFGVNTDVTRATS